MSIALTCDCGARFEVEDLFAGQDVHCPECQHPARVPPVKDAPRRVSLLAIYSLVVAIVGAFTLVGSAAAALLALIALTRMHTGRARRGGAGYAVAALVVAAAGAGATVGILNLPAASQLVGWQRRGGITSRVDTGGPPQVGSRDNACVLTRPAGWGRLLQDRGTDPAIDYLQTDRDLLLTGPKGEAYIDIHRDPGNAGPLRKYIDLLSVELSTLPPTADEDDDLMNRPGQVNVLLLTEPRDLPPVGGYEGVEWLVDLRRGNLAWRWILRAYRKPQPEGKPGPVYVLRAYAPKRRFQEVEPEMRKALDGVQFPP